MARIDRVESMKAYPYAHLYTDLEIVRNSQPILEVGNIETNWRLSKSPVASTELMYYNDDGVAQFHTIILPATHDLGIDAVPALVNESKSRSEVKDTRGTRRGGKAPPPKYIWYSGTAADATLWDKMYAKLATFDELSVALAERGQYFTRDGTLTVKTLDRDAVQHFDQTYADIGQALPQLEGNRAYHYTRASLYDENWYLHRGRSLLYYPVSVLLHIVGKNRVTFLTPNRMEYNVVESVTNMEQLRAGDGDYGVYVGDARSPLISRVASDTLKALRTTRQVADSMPTFDSETGRVAILEEHQVALRAKEDLSRIHKNYDKVYVIGRTIYTTPLTQEDISSITRYGFEYRGVLVYQVEGSIARYPIHYFSRVKVNGQFPPLLPVTRQNNDAPTFPRRLPYSYAEPVIEGSLNLNSQTIRGGSISYTGIVQKSFIPLSNRVITFPRDVGDVSSRFFEVLLPSEIPLEPLELPRVLTSSSSVPILVSSYVNSLAHTNIEIYSGSTWPRGGTASVSYALAPEWYITKVEVGDWFYWYCDSNSASSISLDVWDALRRLQVQDLYHELPFRDTSVKRVASVSTLIRNWRTMRYTRPSSYEAEWNGAKTTYSYVGDWVSETIATLNEFGVLQLYSLPVQSGAYPPISSYPLPVILDTLPPLRRESAGTLILYDSEAAPVVTVRDGHVQMHDPTGMLDTQVDSPDGTYTALIIDNKFVLGDVTDFDAWNGVDLLDYYLSVLKPLTPLDLELVPTRRLVYIYETMHLEGDLAIVSARVPITVGEMDVDKWTEFLGYTDPELVNSTPRPEYGHVTEIEVDESGTLTCHTSSPLRVEYEFTGAYVPADLLLTLAPLATRQVPRRKLAIRGESLESYSYSYYSESDGVELEYYAELPNGLLLYKRDDDVVRLTTVSRDSLDELRKVVLGLLMK